MKKIFTLGILIFILASAVAIPLSISAQTDSGLAIYQKVMTGQVKCADLKDSDFFAIGDYVLNQVPEAQRSALNVYINQYKGTLSDKDFSTLMGKYFTGCRIPTAAEINLLKTSGNTPANVDNSQTDGAEHRSAVATFVQRLLDVANRQGGIGDQVRAIANAQNGSKDNVANEIDKIKNRSGLKTFFIGTDYKTIGQLRSEMVTTGNQIGQLNKLLGQTTDAADKATLQAQIQVLTQEQQKINDFIKANESKFSLFGWFVKLFSK